VYKKSCLSICAQARLRPLRVTLELEPPMDTLRQEITNILRPRVGIRWTNYHSDALIGCLESNTWEIHVGNTGIPAWAKFRLTHAASLICPSLLRHAEIRWDRVAPPGTLPNRFENGVDWRLCGVAPSVDLESREMRMPLDRYSLAVSYDPRILDGSQLLIGRNTLLKRLRSRPSFLGDQIRDILRRE